MGEWAMLPAKRWVLRALASRNVTQYANQF
jgi:hypothetical protein